MLVPELRFSEFIGGIEWQRTPFNKIYTLKPTNSLSRDKLNYDSGSVKNIHYGDIHTKFSTLFDVTNEYVPFVNPTVSLDKVKKETYCQEGDMIFADASEDLNDVGKSIELINLNEEKLISGLHTILARQINNNLIKGFGGYLFKSSAIRKQIKKEAQGTKVLGISAGRICNIDIVYPTDQVEQQKIVGCLSSMDDLISANIKKLDLFKSYKKGLMQRLFPVEGETVPKFRFPEFQEDIEWSKGYVDDLATLIMGNAFKSSHYVKNGVQLVRMGNLYQGTLQLSRLPIYLPHYYEQEYSKFVIKPLDLLMSMTGTVGKEDYGFVVQVPTKSNHLMLNQRVVKLNPKKACVKEFLLQLLKTDYFLKSLYSLPGGTKQANLSGAQLKGLGIKYPGLKEQKKIADYLSSIDDLITAQISKIDSFKNHKNGLMQQLFPTSVDSDI